MAYMTTFPALRTWDFDEADWLASLSTGEKCLIKRLQDFAPFTWNHVPPDSRERSTSMVWVEPTHHNLISSWVGPEKMIGYSWHAQLRQQEINKHQTISKRHPNSNKTLAFGRRQTSNFEGHYIIILPTQSRHFVKGNPSELPEKLHLMTPDSPSWKLPCCLGRRSGMGIRFTLARRSGAVKWDPSSSFIGKKHQWFCASYGKMTSPCIDMYKYIYIYV